MLINRIMRVLGGAMLAATLAFAASPAVAAEAASPGGPAPSTVMLDPAPPAPWVFSGYRFDTNAGCSATGRAYVNSKRYSAYTCRYIAGSYRLYLLPASCPFVAGSVPSRPALLCG